MAYGTDKPGPQSWMAFSSPARDLCQHALKGESSR